MRKWIFLIAIMFLSSLCFADEIIQGHYCYTYGDNESLKEAREFVRTLAIRDAIESYKVFVKSASTVKNFKLTKDLINTISSGYLKNVKILEHTEEGRTVCETIQASVEPREIEKIIKEKRPGRLLQGVWQGYLIEKRKRTSVELALRVDEGNVKGIFSIMSETSEDVTKGMSFVILRPEIVGNKFKFIVPLSGKIDDDAIAFELERHNDRLVGTGQEMRESSQSLPITFTKQK